MIGQTRKTEHFCAASQTAEDSNLSTPSVRSTSPQWTEIFFLQAETLVFEIHVKSGFIFLVW